MAYVYRSGSLGLDTPPDNTMLPAPAPAPAQPEVQPDSSKVLTIIGLGTLLCGVPAIIGHHYWGKEGAIVGALALPGLYSIAFALGKTG